MSFSTLLIIVLIWLGINLLICWTAYKRYIDNEICKKNNQLINLYRLFDYIVIENAGEDSITSNRTISLCNERYIIITPLDKAEIEAELISK